MSTIPRSSDEPNEGASQPAVLVIFAWAFVSIPLAWGVWQTIIKSMALFH